uniref:Uncharacterized protein n=1 Tax=Oryza nivara TaxID=4536 RepID=A0A0E0FFX8_ORYNI
MVVADLDCSVGITLLFVSMVISTVADAQHHNELGCHSMEFQLNDLPRNDFNRCAVVPSKQISKLIAARVSEVLLLLAMKLEHDFHMAIGEAEDNYANNSRLQRKALLKTKPVLDKAVRQVCMALHPRAMIVADLGCSVGANTLLFVSDVVNTVADAQHHDELRCHPMELQFFLNDLSGNDFNQVFKSVKQFTKSIAASHPKGVALPPFYISGLPGSYYTRLFPCQSVHLFHSSYCLHWRSQMIKDMDEKMSDINGGNIYIAKSTPPSVVKMFQDQFQKDMSLFLKLRHQELVPGGQMLLTFLGRKKEGVLDGDLSHLCALLAEALQALVTEGLVEREKLESFNLPLYGPSIDEVKAVIALNKLFGIDHIQLFESNWDPYDDMENDGMCSSPEHGVNVAKSIRAVFEPLLASHFGECILDELFQRYARNVERHLAEDNTKYSPSAPHCFTHPHTDTERNSDRNKLWMVSELQV